MPHPRADTVTMDGVWQPLMQLVPMLKDHLLSLPHLSKGQEPSPQEITIICNLCGSFDEMIDSIGKINWHKSSSVPSNAGYDTLYAHLSGIEPLHTEWQCLKNAVDGLIEFHDKSISQEGGCYPNRWALPIAQQLSRSLSRLMQYMDNYRSHVRNSIDVLSRATVRSLSVLDLPNELLMQIFNFVRDRDSQTTHDIQNARLTCRRFCATSSYFLVDYIRLELQPKSLSRFRDISQHPIISKGIREVCVNIAYYHSEVAEDLQMFALAWATELGDQLFLVDLIKDWGGVLGLSSDRCTTIIENCNKVSQAWLEIANNSGNVPKSETNVETLQICHKKFQQRYRDQQHLLASGSFAQTVATALARMPLAHILTFEDNPFPIRCKDLKPLFEVADDPFAIGKMHIRPLHASAHDELQLNSELPTDVIVTLLGALPGTGATLKNVRIEMESTSNTDLLAPHPTTHKNLVLLAKQLDCVFVRLGEFYRDSYRGPHTQIKRDIYQFLSAILDSDSLQSISIELNQNLWLDGLSFPSIGPLLNSQMRRKLTHLSLAGVSVHGKELQRLISSINPRHQCGGSIDPELHIRLDSVELLSGSWAVVLDALHGNVDSYSSIHYPLGAECLNMSKDEFKRVFARPHNWNLPYQSEAERFIRGCSTALNPMYTASTSTEH